MTKNRPPPKARSFSPFHPRSSCIPPISVINQTSNS
jgi:hypothetical protein